MAAVYPGTDAHVAHLGEVERAVHAHGEVVLARAEALFASHNRPGRHELGIEQTSPDSIVYLDGPAALSVEFGRGPDENGKGAMKGLHILGRAAEL